MSKGSRNRSLHDEKSRQNFSAGFEAAFGAGRQCGDCGGTGKSVLATFGGDKPYEKQLLTECERCQGTGRIPSAGAT